MGRGRAFQFYCATLRAGRFGLVRGTVATTPRASTAIRQVLRVNSGARVITGAESLRPAPG